MTTQRTYLLLLPILIVILTGCFRQASDPVQPVNEALIDELPATTVPVDDATNTPDSNSTEPTDDGQLSVSTSTPVQLVATATSIPTDPPEQPTEASDATESVTGPVQMESPSPTFITPISPNNSAISTATPLATRGIDPTPTDLAQQTPEVAEDACIHEVTSGETLYRISLAYNVSVDAIIEANPGITPSLIIPGDKLVIPDCDTEEPEGDETAGSDTTAEDITTVGSVGEQVHIVVAGDTLGRIASVYGVTQAAIIEANNLANPDRLSIGQKLVIPAPESP